MSVSDGTWPYFSERHNTVKLTRQQFYDSSVDYDDDDHNKINGETTGLW